MNGHDQPGALTEADEATTGQANRMLTSFCAGRIALLLEDEPDTSAPIREALLMAGFGRVDVVERGEEALRRASSDRYDVLLLDRMNPGMDGLSVLARLRAMEETPRNSARTPALIITAMTDEGSRIDGLLAGADDYIGKPVSLAEVVARTAARLRRANWNVVGDRAVTVIRNGPLHLRPATGEVLFRGSPVKLSARPAKVLGELIRLPGQPVSRDTLWARAWSDWKSKPEDLWVDSVEACLRRLRNGLRDEVEPHLPPAACPLIMTVRGAGVMLRDLSEFTEET